MSKGRTPGFGLKGAELLKAISTLGEFEKLSQEEEMEEAASVEASQGLAAKVVSEKITDLLATLRAKAEGPLVTSAELILSFKASSFPLKVLFPFQHRLRFPR
jgi:hypothetical protein